MTTDSATLMQQPSTTAETVTYGQLIQLREQADDAGDEEMVAECDRALAGDAAALARCAQFIADMEE